MSVYELSVEFDDADLEVINRAAQKITITRHVAGQSANQVAWVAFSPLENNSIQWEDSYYLYASNSEIQNGATIKVLSDKLALETKQLPFTSTGIFGNPTSVILPQGKYGLANQYTTRPSMVFGLAQTATVQGVAVPASPLNASLVPMNQFATFQPLDKIEVSLEANADNGMVISRVSSNALPITFGGSVTKIACKYNAAIGGFQLVG